MAELLVGPKILLMGEGGTGKTHSLGTLVDWCAANNLEVFALFTENGRETLLGYWKDRGLPIPDCLHWHDTKTRPVSLASLMTAAENVGKLTYDGITKLTDMNRSGDNNAFYKILLACKDFPDDRTGKKFGAVDEWGADRVFINDSLSETANACMKMVIGSKPTASQPDYGVAQNNLMNFLRICTQATSATVVITAHVERELDAISGVSKIFVSSIGKALAASIPPLFSEVLYTVREGDKFYWDTAAFGVATKTRSLGYRSKIPPDFAAIMNVWKKRSTEL